MKLSVTERLLSWYDADIRELPWKKSRDPFSIWLSEIILQQTRVQQGIPYYLKFIDRFENVESLANAELDEVLKLWEGLGYYSRARNLHRAAKQVVEDFDGQFPKDYESLLQLKGVGDYTASAIASFAYDEPVAVVDGNVFRFLSRLFGITDPIDSTAGKKKFKQLAMDVLNEIDPASHNQAIMDFGALVCLPKNPLCADCVFSSDCVARNEDRIAMLPVKSNKIKRRNRVFNYYILHDEAHMVIEKRNENDIWNGLFQFPLWESLALKEEPDLKSPDDEFIAEAIRMSLSISSYKWYKQVLSHQNIKASFTVVRIKDLSKIKLPAGWKKIMGSEFLSYPYPKIIHTFLSENGELSNKHHIL